MARSGLVFALIILSNLNTWSQLKWKRADTAFGILPKGIRVYRTSDSLNGRPFVAYYAEVKLKSKKIYFSTQVGYGKRYTPEKYYLSEDSPTIVVNGTFFSFETNQNLNAVIQHGNLIAYNLPAVKSKTSDSFYYPTRSAIGITRKRRADVAWLFTDTSNKKAYAFQAKPIIAKGKTQDPTIEDLNTLEFWKWWKMETAIGGGPMLIQKGKIFITNKEEQLFVSDVGDKHPRTAMGYTKRKRLIILVIQGRAPGIAEGATLQEEAIMLKSLGCKEALNLDGGGSSCMLINGKETIKPSDKDGQRPVPAVFLVGRKKN